MLFAAQICAKCGGGSGIRTHVGVNPNGFQDRLVMTASISLRVNNIDIISLNNIIVNSFFEKNKKIRISDFFIEIFINRYALLVFCIVPALFLEFW